MGTSLEENINWGSWLVRVVAVILALAFIGGLGYTGGIPGTGPAAGVAVTVNGDPVPLSYYRIIRKRIYDSQTQNLDRVSVELQDAIDRVALAFLIERKLLAGKARDMGLRAPESSIRRAITENPAFLLDGEFAGVDYYKEAVRRGLGMSPGQFENMLKDNYLALQMASLSKVSSVRPDAELENLFEFSGERVKAEYIEFDDEASAQAALKSIEEGESIRSAAKQSGLKTEKTEFFSRFEIPARLGYGVFSLSPGGGAAMFSSGGGYAVAVVLERKAEKPSTVREKIRIAKTNTGRAELENYAAWVGEIQSSAKVRLGKEIREEMNR